MVFPIITDWRLLLKPRWTFQLCLFAPPDVFPFSNRLFRAVVEKHQDRSDSEIQASTSDRSQCKPTGSEEIFVFGIAYLSLSSRVQDRKGQRRSNDEEAMEG